MSKKITSPNDSLLQSTREPSTRSGDRTSLDASSFSVTRRLLTGGSQMGGGSYKSYILDHLARMHSDIESTTRKLELEQRRLYNLDKTLANAESEYNQKREKYKLFQNAQDDAVQHKAAKVKQLERQLVKAIEDLNKGNCDNEQLREQIDQLRRERQILDLVFKQMVRDINGNKKTMERVKQTMVDSKMTSEEAKQKTRALNKLLERERRDFKDMTNKMQKDMQNQSEVQKEQDNLHRFTRAQDKQNSGGQGKNRRTYMVADEEEAFSETAMHRRILKLSFLNTIQRRHIKQHQKNIEVFEQAFATIKSSTGISDIDEIVKIFIALEQRNFSLLTYVNQLNREIESIEIRNRELQLQKKKYEKEQDESEKRKADAVNELCVQIQKTRAATEDKEKMIEDSTAALTECRPLIWNIVKFLKQEMPALINAGHEGDPPPMKTASPDDHEENLNNYLMYIEEMILQFRVSLSRKDAEQERIVYYQQHMALPAWQEWASHNDPKAFPSPSELLAQVGPSSARPKAQQVPPKPTKPTELPSAHITGDDSDDDPDTGLGDRPWTRNELRERAQAMIQRRKRKQHGKLIGEEKRADPMDDATGTGDTARKDMAPPPTREYAASSIASKESKDDSGASLSKSPSMSGKQPSDNFAEGGAALREDEEGGDRKAMWWREQRKPAQGR